MLRFLFRLSGGLALAGAFSQIVVDAARWIAGGDLSLTPLADLIMAAAPGRIEALGAKLDVSAPWALAPMQAGLSAPAFAALALLAGALLFLARPAHDPAHALLADRRA